MQENAYQVYIKEVGNMKLKNTITSVTCITNGLFLKVLPFPAKQLLKYKLEESCI